MALTHIDCHVYRGKGASLDTSSFVAINPSRRPGSLVLAGAVAVRESIGSQVACKLGLEHFVDGVLSYYSKPDGSADGPSGNEEKHPEISLEVLEAAFRNANSSVYNFGHKLAAGGRLAASLIGVVLEDKTIAAGRVGDGVVYLYRKGNLLPFFEEHPDKQEGRTSESYIGANSMVSVELASIAAEEGDVILVFPQSVGQEKELAIGELITAAATSGQNPSAEICKKLFGDVFRLPFSMFACLGPETIYLAEAV